MWEWSRTAPKFVVSLKLSYVDFLNEDNFGNPLPWVEFDVSADCPNEETSFGLFKTYCLNRSFRPMINKSVTAILAPYPSYNRPVSVDRSSSRSLFFGVMSGLAGSSGKRSRDNDINIVSIIGRIFNKFSLRGKISDFWVASDGNCYFKSVFKVHWRLFRESLCERLHAQAGQGVMSALKAQMIQSVTLYVQGLDLFERSSPRISAMMEEGILLGIVGDVDVTLAIDPNPQNVVDAAASQKMARNTRAFSLVAQGAMNMLGGGGGGGGDAYSSYNAPKSYTSYSTGRPY